MTQKVMAMFVLVPVTPSGLAMTSSPPIPCAARLLPLTLRPAGDRGRWRPRDHLPGLIRFWVGAVRQLLISHNRRGLGQACTAGRRVTRLDPGTPQYVRERLILQDRRHRELDHVAPAMGEGGQGLGILALGQDKAPAQIQLGPAPEQPHPWRGLAPGLKKAGDGLISCLGWNAKGQDKFHGAPPGGRKRLAAIRCKRRLFHHTGKGCIAAHERPPSGVSAALLHGFGVHTRFVQKLSLTYYTHNYPGDRPILFCV